MKIPFKKRKIYRFGTHDIAEACGLSERQVRYRYKRGDLNPKDFMSVVRFVAKHHVQHDKTP